MIKALIARLWMNGILLVRMTWIINVCVNKLSTDQPVRNKAGLSLV